MNEKTCFAFRLASPQYRRFLDFIAKGQNMTPGKVLNRFIYSTVYEVMDEQASKQAHKQLAMGFDLPIEAVSWVCGSRSDHWTKLAAVTGKEKALEYKNRFIPLWDELIKEIDGREGLNYFGLVKAVPG